MSNLPRVPIIIIMLFGIWNTKDSDTVQILLFSSGCPHPAPLLPIIFYAAHPAYAETLFGQAPLFVCVVYQYFFA